MNVQRRRKISFIPVSVALLFSTHMLSSEVQAEERVFAPSLSIEQTYNENIFYLDRYQEDDFSVTIGLDLPIKFSSPTRTFLISYSPFAEFYRDNDDLNYTGHMFETAFDYRGKLSHFRIFDVFYNTQLQGDPAAFEGLPTSVTRRTDIISNRFDLLYGLRIRNISFLNFNFNHSLMEYDDIPSFDFEDTTSYSASFDNLFSMGRLIHQMGYFYSYREFLFETAEDQVSNAFGLSYKYEVLEKTTVIIRIGGYKVSGGTVEQQNNFDPLFHFDASRELRKGSIRLFLSRDLGVGSGERGLSENDSAHIGFSYPLTRRSSLNISSSYYDRDAFEIDLADYRTFAISSSFDLRIFRNLSLFLTHRYLNQQSRGTNDLDAKYNVYSLILRYYPFEKSF